MKFDETVVLVCHGLVLYKNDVREKKNTAVKKQQDHIFSKNCFDTISILS